MGCVLVVAAEPRELSGVLRYAGNGIRLQWPVDYARCVEMHGRRLVLLANGPGPRLAGDAVDVALDREQVEVVISTGYCGALDPAIKPCDIFVASLVEAPELGRSFPALLPAASRPFASGRLVSADTVIQTVEEKKLLRAQGAAAVEMEAAAVASRAERQAAPFYCIRVVTDTAEEGFSIDFNAMRDSTGRFRRSAILAAAARRPLVLFPHLVGLLKRCRAAAGELGDFLADCRF